ncbi:MAG: S24/S26 family peptidase [Christensenellales bacterium]|jgi:hypothetical protein
MRAHRADSPAPLAARYPAIRQTLIGGGNFLLIVTGGSMEPFLRHLRDRAALELPEARALRRGDIVLFERDCGQFVLHRVLRVRADGRFDAIGDAQWQRETGIPRDALRARVKCVIRDGRPINCDHGAWRALMTFYMLARVTLPRLTRLALRIRRVIFQPTLLGIRSLPFPNRHAR